MSRVWKLRDVVLTVILSVVCGAVYMGWDYLAGLIPSAVSPAAWAAMNGMWWIASGLAAYIVRRPGVALLAGFASAFFEFAFGSPYGAGVLISGLLQGGGAEVGLLLLGWRRWNLGALMFSGLVGGIGNSIQWYFQYGGDKYSVGVVIGYIVITMVSGAIIAGLLPKLIGDALKRTGVVRNFELGRASSEKALP